MEKNFSSAEQIAYQLLKKYNQTTECNPFLIAKKLGIEVYLYHFTDKIFSFLTTSKEGKAKVYLNGTIPIQRLRYNMALQIYNYISGISETAYFQNHLKSKHTIRAKDFASSMLLPEERLKEVIKPYLNKNGKIKYNDIIFIAEHFGVSFKTTAFKIFYKFHNIEGIDTLEQLRDRVGENVIFQKARNCKVPDHKTTDLKYLKQMIDCLTFLPVDKIKDAMWTKLVQDVAYGDIKVAEQINLKKEDVEEIIANYKLTGKAYLKGAKTDDSLMLQDLVEGQLKAYEFIFSDDAKDFAQKNTFHYLLPVLHEKLFSNISHGRELFHPGQFVNELTPARTVGLLFHIPKERDINNTRWKVEEKLWDILENKDKLSNSEFIDQAIEVFFQTYTSQLFNDGNSRVSKALLNFLLVSKGIPASFSVADNILQEYRKAIASLGYDQRIRHHQNTGSFESKVINKKTKEEGKCIETNFGITLVKYPNQEEREYDEEIEEIQYLVTSIFVPEWIEKKIPHLIKEPVWEPLRKINYDPLQVVVYQAILSSYIDCIKNPTLSLKPDENKKKNI